MQISKTAKHCVKPKTEYFEEIAQKLVIGEQFR